MDKPAATPGCEVNPLAIFLERMNILEAPRVIR